MKKQLLAILIISSLNLSADLTREALEIQTYQEEHPRILVQAALDHIAEENKQSNAILQKILNLNEKRINIGRSETPTHEYAPLKWLLPLALFGAIGYEVTRDAYKELQEKKDKPWSEKKITLAKLAFSGLTTVGSFGYIIWWLVNGFKEINQHQAERNAILQQMKDVYNKANN